MKINLFEIITTILIILLIFSFSFYQTSNVEPANLCKEDLNCIMNLIDNNENNSNYCSELSNSAQCYETIAFTINSNFCNKTNNSTKCFENNAVLKEDTNLCEFVDDYDNCIFQVAINNEKEVICEKSENKDRCYYSYALAKEDLSVCEKANTLMELCLDKIESD